MMSSTSNSTGNGIGCGTVLFFIFLTLKLTGHIDWSWWWVTAPLWAPLVICALFFCACFLLALLTGQLSSRSRK